jgi:hypothetical protein
LRKKDVRGIISDNYSNAYVLHGATQRLALPAAGGTRLSPETDKTQSHEKSQFGGENPAVRVHALLGAHTKCQPMGKNGNLKVFRVPSS